MGVDLPPAPCYTEFMNNETLRNILDGFNQYQLALVVVGIVIGALAVGKWGRK